MGPTTSAGPRFRSQDVLHVLSQAGQPYGSERRCCNHCGIMIWGGEEPAHVDNWEDWRAAVNNCQAMELAEDSSMSESRDPLGGVS